MASGQVHLRVAFTLAKLSTSNTPTSNTPTPFRALDLNLLVPSPPASTSLVLRETVRPESDTLRNNPFCVAPVLTVGWRVLR
jgi:hypothetical protein